MVNTAVDKVYIFLLLGPAADRSLPASRVLPSSFKLRRYYPPCRHLVIYSLCVVIEYSYDGLELTNCCLVDDEEKQQKISFEAILKNDYIFTYQHVFLS